MNCGQKLVLALISACLLGLNAARAAEPPKLDKDAVAKYLRYAEGYTPQVQITISDPTSTVFPGFYELKVTLKAGSNEVVRRYYTTQSGEQLFSGPIYDLQKSPFAANLPLLKEEGAPAFGPENARVRIYVFSDFECPYCREEAKTLRQTVAKDHPNDVRVVFKDFPLESIHPWARKAALAGQCIASQKPDSFWAFHDWIYEHQSEVNPSNVDAKVQEFAKSQGLDAAKLTSCEADPKIAARIDKTVEEARQLGVTQTPTMFVNGRSLPGVLSPQQMNLLIQMELGRAQESAQSQKCCEVSVPTVAHK